MTLDICYLQMYFYLIKSTTCLLCFYTYDQRDVKGHDVLCFFIFQQYFVKAAQIQLIVVSAALLHTLSYFLGVSHEIVVSSYKN